MKRIVLFIVLLFSSIIEAKEMKIIIDEKIYNVILENNPSSEELLKNLPFTLKMRDYNSNEKVASLPFKIPSNDKRVGRIEVGDIMLWAGNSLVIFYDSFSTPYSYTKVGKIKEVKEFKNNLGRGEVLIKFDK